MQDTIPERHQRQEVESPVLDKAAQVWVVEQVGDRMMVA
jgi:streptogramin lyase